MLRCSELFREAVRFAGSGPHMLVLGVLVSLVGPAHAANITPDVIFGSGNANGDFTVSQSDGVELGLRAKLRFDDTNQPQNVFNYDGTDTYTFEAGLPPTGFGFAPGSTSTAVWNFEWSINTNFDGSTNLMLDDLTYAIRIDSDPSLATSFLEFDLINVPYADHAIGTNATLNGDGTVAADGIEYAALIDANNVAQNSWNMEFFFDAPDFNGNDVGTYEIQLEAFDSLGQSVASTSITVNSVAVPEPGAALLAAVALLFTSQAARRRA